MAFDEGLPGDHIDIDALLNDWCLSIKKKGEHIKYYIVSSSERFPRDKEIALSHFDEAAAHLEVGLDFMIMDENEAAYVINKFRKRCRVLRQELADELQ